MDFNPATLTDKELIRMADGLAVTRELVTELVKRFNNAKNSIDTLREHINKPKHPNRAR